MLAETAGEVLDAAEIDAGLGPQAWAEKIAAALLIRELSGGPKGFLLDRGVTELALQLEFLTVPAEAGVEASFYLLVADYAKPLKTRSFLVGNAYQDANGNWRPELGEGIKGARVSLRTLDGRWHKTVLTGVLGELPGRTALRGLPVEPGTRRPRGGVPAFRDVREPASGPSLLRA